MTRRRASARDVFRPISGSCALLTSLLSIRLVDNAPLPGTVSSFTEPRDLFAFRRERWLEHASLDFRFHARAVVLHLGPNLPLGLGSRLHGNESTGTSRLERSHLLTDGTHFLDERRNAPRKRIGGVGVGTMTNALGALNHGVVRQVRREVLEVRFG
jgi:hypothetical protein